MTPKSQWCTATKVYFLLTPMSMMGPILCCLYSRTQTEDVLSLFLWNTARLHSRREETWRDTLDLQASVPKWRMPLLLSFHWPEQVLWPPDDRFRAHNSSPGRLCRRGEIQSTTAGLLPIQTQSNAREVDSHEALLMGWPRAFSEPQSHSL